MSYGKLSLIATVWLLLSIGCVVGLVKYSESLKSAPQNFLRLFPPHPVLERDTFLLGYNSYYLAGIDSHHVYLGNYGASLHLVVANLELQDTTHVTLQFAGLDTVKFRSIRVKVVPPYVYMADGTVPVVYRARIGEWKGAPHLSDNVFFLDFLPAPNGSVSIKSLSGQTGENILGRLSDWPPYAVFNKSVLKKQLDGVFCTDGIMRFNEASNNIIYVHHYRNEVLVLDTAMNLVQRTHTLDTISRVRISTATITSENARTLASPPYFVNLRADVSANRLFVHSGLLASNEHRNAFESAAAIDVYALPEMTYQFSFYVRDYRGGHKLREFMVYDNQFVALFDTQLVVYELEPSLFDW
jgi:hypothetical protein